MKLWTIQPKEWYDKLQEQNVIFGEKQYVPYFLLDAYDWLIDEMDKRIGEKPHFDCYPIWAWYQYDSEKKPKPDLRCSDHLKKGTHGVRIEIEKKDKDVILSDFTLWHFPITKHYIADSESDNMEFDNLLEKNGFIYSDPDFESIPTVLKNQIINSWNKILDLKYLSAYQSGNISEKKIQATFWSLNVNEIVKVTEFIAR